MDGVDEILEVNPNKEALPCLFGCHDLITVLVYSDWLARSNAGDLWTTHLQACAERLDPLFLDNSAFVCHESLQLVGFVYSKIIYTKKLELSMIKKQKAHAPPTFRSMVRAPSDRRGRLQDLVGTSTMDIEKILAHHSVKEVGCPVLTTRQQ